MNLTHIKLKNGQDVIAYADHASTEILSMEHPVILEYHVEYGLTARWWSAYSEPDRIDIRMSDTLFVNPASEVAIEQYENFVKRMSSNQYDLEDYTVH